MTQQQEDFKKAVREHPGSFILQALAGTGKTTTLLDACPSGPTLALAFNKRIQQELADRFPQNVKCQTFNGLGHGTWQKSLGRFPAVNQNKLYSITHAILKDLNDSDCWKYMGDIMKLASAARSIGIVPSRIAARRPCAPLVPDDIPIWEDLADNESMPLWLTEPARKVLEESTRAGLQGDIDFGDQLYLPVVFRAPFPKGKYGTIIVDEAQDLGPLEHKMVELCLGKNARLIAAGDHHQAIYGWKGAHADSMFRLKNLTDATEMPLTVSFRCPKAVVEEAAKLVPEFEAAEDSIEGTVEHWANKWTPHDLNLPNTAVLCRNNKPLFILAMKMIQARIPCKMQGRDIGTGLKKIIKQLTEEDIPTAELEGLVVDWIARRRDDYLVKGDKAKATKVEDQGESILAVAETCATSNEVIKVIDDLFGRKSKGVTLSTIHKAKGLEWENVFILDADLIGKRAKAEWAKQQERNLHYVAITRAQQSLTYLESD